MYLISLRICTVVWLCHNFIWRPVSYHFLFSLPFFPTLYMLLLLITTFEKNSCFEKNRIRSIQKTSIFCFWSQIIQKYESGQRGSENHGNRKDDIKRNGDSFDYRSSYSNNNRKSRSASSSDTRHSANSSHHIKDDKDGHLIYKVGDWLQNRCTKHFL